MDQELRKKAQELLNGEYDIESAIADAKLPELLTEIRIYQIELQLQNEELRHTQAELEAAREKYFEYYQLAPVGYLILDFAGIVLEINLTSSEILKKNKSQIINRPLIFHIHPYSLNAYQQHLEIVRTTSSSHQVEVRLKTSGITYLRIESKRVTKDDITTIHSVLTDITEQTRSKQLLEQQTQQLNYAQTIAKTGSWWHNFKTGEGIWSEELYRLFGYKPGEVDPSFDRFMEHIHEDDHEIVEVFVSKALQESIPFNVEVRFRISGLDDIHYARIASMPQRRLQKDEAVLFGVFQDITQEKVVQNKLHFLNQTAIEMMAINQEQHLIDYLGHQLVKLIDNAMILINTFDINTGLVHTRGIYGINRTLIDEVNQLTGFDIENLTYSPPSNLEYVSGIRLNHFEGTFADLTNNRIPVEISHEIAKLLDIHDIYLIGDKLFADIHIYMRHHTPITGTDMIETLVRQADTSFHRIRLQSELKQRESQLRTIIENFPGGYIMLFDRDLRFVIVDGQGLLHPDDKFKMQGNYVYDTVLPSVRDEIVERYREVLKGKSFDNVTVEIGDRILEDQLLPIYDENNDIIAGLVIARDVTEQRQAQEHQFKLAIERERIEILNHFVRDALHEFRTPLTVISMSAERLVTLDEQEKREKRSQQIFGQIERITSLVDTLIQFTVLQTTEELFKSKANIHSLINYAIRRIQSRFDADCPPIEFNPSPSVITVEVNEEYVLEAFTKILHNAVRYGDKDNKITIETTLQDNLLTIQIIDNGIGITRTDQEKVMESFWRKDTAHNTPGFGLGLPYAKLVFEKHGGTLDLTSQYKVGTRVTVTLKLSPESS